MAELESSSSDIVQRPNKKQRTEFFRKRRFTVGVDHFKGLQKKRRKDFVPTSFLLGGNIHDPLNLKSIKVNDNPNQITPETSPSVNSLNVEKGNVIIPVNLKDPLNLAGSESIHEPEPMTSFDKCIHMALHKRNKRRRTSSETDLIKRNNDQKCFEDRASDDLYLPRTKCAHFSQVCKHDYNHEDRVASTSRFARNNYKNFKNNDRNNSHIETKKETQEPKFSKRNKNEKFQYGNYNRYYGYRNALDYDPRIKLFSTELFHNKEVLDIGCNVGHVTIAIARDYSPKKIVGIDIDPTLINAANKNIRHYITETIAKQELFPSSMPILYGPILAMPDQSESSTLFPNNIAFVSVNYVPESDECVENQEPKYDCVLCLSVTKWIHLNWGDVGVKRLFKRIFLHLKPGGHLILEPQHWSSYYKKSKMTVRFINYNKHSNITISFV